MKSANKTFIFKYDSESSIERMLTNFRQAVKGELKLVEPNIVRSNSIEALLHGVTKERLELFSVLVEKRPDDLKQLADYLSRDYQSVYQDAKILAKWGIIQLEGENEKIKLQTPYKKIVLEFPAHYTQVSPVAKSKTSPQLSL